MRILFVADGRSPIALNWIDYFLEREYEIHLVSTFPCEPDARLAGFKILPVAFSGMKHKPAAGGKAAPARGRLWSAGAVGLRTGLRQWFGPMTLPWAAATLCGWVREIQPDLVHAMRIPYEGMVATMAGLSAPVLVSVWGNDFTLHARSNPWMGWLTKNTLRRAAGLHTDCQRDVRLAHQWGFDAHKPVLVVPGAGGIKTELFYPPSAADAVPSQQQSLTIVNPRGFRSYVRNDVFFQAVAKVVRQKPSLRFVCPDMQGESLAQRWINDLAIEKHTLLLPKQSRQQMADLFRSASMVISPSVHDGTPNTLLEAMACGCFPVAGDLESLREWIRPGENGLLVDPTNPVALAQAILSALDNPQLFARARDENFRLIAERARYDVVMGKVEQFYKAF